MLCIILASILVAAKCEIAIIQHPTPQSVMLGDHVTISCRIKNLPRNIPVEWMKNGVFLGQLVSGGNKFKRYPRYKMEIDFEKGVYDITIEKVSLRDAGNYECQATYFRENQHPVPLKSESAKLDVLVYPSGPVIANVDENSVYKLNEGKSPTLSCSGLNGNPKPRVTWLINEKVETASVHKEYILSDKNLWNTIADLKLEAIEDFVENNYTCIVEPSKQLAEDRITYKKTIRIKTIAKPKSNLVVTHNGPVFAINQDVYFECNASSDIDVPITDYRWYQNGTHLQKVVSRRFGISSINSSYDGTNISCDAFNEAGYSKMSTTTLYMRRPPLIKLLVDKIVKFGSSVTFICLFESNLHENQITWTRLKDGKILSNQRTYNIVNATVDDSGLYECTVTNRVGSDKQQLNFEVKGPPVIKSDKNQAFKLGSTAELVCEYTTTSNIIKMEWSWTKMSNKSEKTTTFILSSENNTITNDLTRSTTTKYKTVLNRKNNVGRLIISNLNENDFRHVPKGYKCTISNEYGTSSINIKLHEDTSKLILILCGLVGSVIATILIFLILFSFIRKKLMKKDVQSTKTVITPTINFQRKSSADKNIETYDEQSTIDPKSSDDEKLSRRSSDTRSFKSSTELNGAQSLIPACDEGYATEGCLPNYKVYQGKYESKGNNMKNYPGYNFGLTATKSCYDSKSDILSSRNNPYNYVNDRCLSTVSMFNKPVQNLPRHGKMIAQWQNSKVEYTPLSTQEVFARSTPYTQYLDYNKTALRYHNSKNAVNQIYSKNKPRMSTQV